MFETIPKIRIFLNLLLLLEILIGLAIIVVTWFHHRILAAFLTDAEGRLLSSKFFNVYILGFHMVATFACGLSMWATLWPRRYSENVQLLLTMWLVFCLVMVASGCATVWTLMASCSTLSEEIEIVLFKGVDIYYMNPEWKLLWDRLQYTNECCGVHGYQDWVHAAWMTDTLKDYEQLREGTTECGADYNDWEAVGQHLDLHQILAPYACCKRNSTYCYENYVPHRKRGSASSGLPHLNLTDINTGGCFPHFTRHLRTTAHILLGLVLSAVAIDLTLCCLVKYLMRTNYRRCYREFNNDLCMFDDEGNSLVIIQCPPKVRCLMLEQPNTFCGSDIPNLASSCDLCPCCSGSQDVAVAQEHNIESKNNKTPLVH